MATDDHYVADEDSLAAGNVIVDDAGSKADIGGAGQPPIITGIDGPGTAVPGQPLAFTVESSWDVLVKDASQSAGPVRMNGAQ